MYFRLFHDLWESSLMMEDVKVRWLFVTLLGMADERRAALVDVPLFTLARRAAMSEEDTRACLKRLMEPDEFSRSPREEGRRILPLRPDQPERGWEIVNWEEFDKQMKKAHRREYVRQAVARHRAMKKDVARVVENRERVADGITGNQDVIEKDGMVWSGVVSLPSPVTQKLDGEGVGVAAESAAPPAEPLSDLEFPVAGKGGKTWRAPEGLISELVALYPDVDVRHECKKAIAKLSRGVVTRKTARGMPTFLHSWMERTQNGRPRGRPIATPGDPVREEPRRASENPLGISVTKDGSACVYRGDFYRRSTDGKRWLTDEGFRPDGSSSMHGAKDPTLNKRVWSAMSAAVGSVVGEGG